MSEQAPVAGHEEPKEPKIYDPSEMEEGQGPRTLLELQSGAVGDIIDVVSGKLDESLPKGEKNGSMDVLLGDTSVRLTRQPLSDRLFFSKDGREYSITGYGSEISVRNPDTGVTFSAFAREGGRGDGAMLMVKELEGGGKEVTDLMSGTRVAPGTKPFEIPVPDVMDPESYRRCYNVMSDALDPAFDLIYKLKPPRLREKQLPQQEIDNLIGEL